MTIGIQHNKIIPIRIITNKAVFCPINVPMDKSSFSSASTVSIVGIGVGSVDGVFVEGDIDGSVVVETGFAVGD